MKRNEIASILLEFAEFMRIADRQEFIEAFGGRMGDHLWSKLVNGYRRDFGNLLCALDGDNVELLAKHLKKKGAL